MLIGEKGGAAVKSKLIIMWQIERNSLPLLKYGLMKKSIKKNKMDV